MNNLIETCQKSEEEIKVDKYLKDLFNKLSSSFNTPNDDVTIYHNNGKVEHIKIIKE